MTEQYRRAILAAMAPPRVWIGDGADSRYQFSVFSIFERPERKNCVYSFAIYDGASFTHLYIGRAQELGERLSNHEKLNDALSLGSNVLLVHSPGPACRVNYQEAEKRLISFYEPQLNVQHVNALASMFR